MSARTPPRTGAWRAPSAPALAALAAAAGGAAWGLAAARLLFELDPLRFNLFGAWPATLALGALGLAAALAASLALQPVRNALWPWSPAALAMALFSVLAPDVNLLRSLALIIGALALLALLLIAPARPDADHRRREFLLSLSLFLFLFLLYLKTLAPAVGNGDTFEFQVDIVRLGIAHGSGYPLLMLLGRLFTWLPVGGTLAFRANLTSAFFGALAGLGVARLARRLGASSLAALLAGLAFGLSPTLWSRAVEIEAYTLNAAFITALLYLAATLLESTPSADPSPHLQLPLTNYQLLLCLLALLFGLSLTNHLTTLLLAPAIVAVVALGRLRSRRASANPPRVAGSIVHRPAKRSIVAFASVLRPLSFVLISLLLGLSVYLYLPLRWPAVNHGQALSLAGFVNILTGNEAKGAFQWRLPFQDLGRYAIVWGKIAGEFGWPGLALALLGAAGLAWRRRWGVLVMLGLAYSGYVYFALAFNVPDPDFSAFFIPLHLIAVLLMALGLQTLLDLAARTAWAAPLTLGIAAAFSLLPLTSLWRTYPLVDKSNDWAGQRAGELMLSQPLAAHAAILADSEKIAPLDYLQAAEGVRPDLDIIVLPDEASYRAALDERLAAGQAVYLGRYLPGLGAAYSLRSVGPLAEVSPTPFLSTPLTLQPAVGKLNINNIELDGYAPLIGQTSLSAGTPGPLGITLAWHALAVPSDNLLVNLRLVDGAGQSAWQSAGSVPVSGLYPTNAWRKGEVISDFYSLPVPDSLPPGVYQLQVALLPPFAPAPAAAWSPVAPVTILPPAQTPAPPHLLRAKVGPGWLLGYDVPAAVAPGSSYAITLYWLRTTEAQAVPGPFSPARLTSIAAWPVGALVPVVYPLMAPKAGSEISLAVDGGGLAECGWLAPETRLCPLPAIALAGQAAAEGAINFDNQILLNAARLETPSAAPGGSVRVSLEWQALQAIGQDYTVFVHLLGPDGLVHGQVDQWPVSGTRATSTWSPGESIADAYNVPLAPDAPPGPYQVEVGLYLLATGNRLPVLNAGGLPVDNRLLLSGLTVTR